MSEGPELLLQNVVLYHLAEGPDLRLAREGDSGYDLSAVLSVERELFPGGYWQVATGLTLELPPWLHARIQARSGLFANHGVFAFPGLIDSGYRGEVLVTLWNTSKHSYMLRPGDRVAQLVLELRVVGGRPIAPVAMEPLQLQRVTDKRHLNLWTDRGMRGHGSSGR